MKVNGTAVKLYMILFLFLFLFVVSTKCIASSPFLSSMVENGIELVDVRPNPLAHYWTEREEYFQNSTGNIFVLIADIDGDGETDYLISDSLLRSANLEQKWVVYLRHNSKFWLVRGEFIQTITFDSTKAYIGYLDEIDKWGIIHYSSTDRNRGAIFTTSVELKIEGEKPVANITSQRMLRNYQNKQWDGPGKHEAMSALVTRYFLNRGSNLESLKIYSVDKSWVPLQ